MFVSCTLSFHIPRFTGEVIYIFQRHPCLVLHACKQNFVCCFLNNLFAFSKTAIAIDTIINQKKFNEGTDESKS